MGGNILQLLVVRISIKFLVDLVVVVLVFDRILWGVLVTFVI